MQLTIEELANIAMQMESNHNIDWNNTLTTKSDAYLLMAANAIEILKSAHKEEVMAATVTHLLVENFMLNLQIYG